MALRTRLLSGLKNDDWAKAPLNMTKAPKRRPYNGECGGIGRSKPDFDRLRFAQAAGSKCLDPKPCAKGNTLSISGLSRHDSARRKRLNPIKISNCTLNFSYGNLRYRNKLFVFCIFVLKKLFIVARWGTNNLHFYFCFTNSLRLGRL